MRTGTRRLLTVSAASLVLVCSASPATAEAPVSDEVAELPAALVDELAQAERQTLTELTQGEGVRLEAFVVTPDGPQIVSLDADRRADAAAAVRLLDQQASVEAAALSTPVRAAGGWYWQYGNEMLRAEQARVEAGAANLGTVVVAVLDTGVAAHPELATALVAGRNVTGDAGGPLDTTDRDGHGTHVAGTIGADVGSDVEGVAAGVRIMPVKVLDDTGNGWTHWAAEGIVWAADHGADVINLSLAGPEMSSVQTRAVEYARSKGVTLVAAAGNGDSSGGTKIAYPAADPGVIGVAAVGESGQRAWWSNAGYHVDVAAPGVDINSTTTWKGIAKQSGTSMAAAHVAGVAALMVAAAPRITPDQVAQALTTTATDLGPFGRDDAFGHGLVDAVRAVQSAEVLAGPEGRTPVAPRAVEAAGVPGGVRLSWTAPQDAQGTVVTSYRMSAYRGIKLIKSVVVSGQARSATITGLANGTVYRVGVTAMNAAGQGPPSKFVLAKPRTTPGAPTITTVTARKKAVVVRWAKPAVSGGVAISGYVVQTYSGNRLVRSVGVKATARSVTVGKLPPGRKYTFRVLAKNAAGAGTASTPRAARPR